MKTREEKLFKLIKEKLPKNVSLIDDIADVLDINYDASYRRIKGKTALTLKEGLKLSEHYNLDFNKLLIRKQTETREISVEKTHGVISDSFLEAFFDNSKLETETVLNSENGQIINCAKDFPFYHTDNKVLKKFRIFLFINMLSKDIRLKKMSFSEFEPTQEISKKYNAFLNQYERVSLVEIWNDSTIDNILNQIKYFFEVGLITKIEAISIADGLTKSLKLIEEQAENQKRDKSKNKYQLYHNNLISLLNTVLMKTDFDTKVFIPYTNLTYFKVTDENTTTQIEEHLSTQLQYSTNISGEASVSRKMFFNKMYQKIEKMQLKISL
tara:strand:- start:6411 stop:7388 length:978 start_codon:yes stop_codon:yes gene_type:complete